MQGIKVIVRRERPDGSSGFSFPSGHATITMAGATVLQQHLGWKAAVPTYAIAAYVRSISRARQPALCQRCRRRRDPRDHHRPVGNMARTEHVGAGAIRRSQADGDFPHTQVSEPWHPWHRGTRPRVPCLRDFRLKAEATDTLRWHPWHRDFRLKAEATDTLRLAPLASRLPPEGGSYGHPAAAPWLRDFRLKADATDTLEATDTLSALATSQFGILISAPHPRTQRYLLIRQARCPAVGVNQPRPIVAIPALAERPVPSTSVHTLPQCGIRGTSIAARNPQRASEQRPEAAGVAWTMSNRARRWT